MPKKIKVLSIAEFEGNLMETLEETMSGVVVRVKLPSGALLELTPLPAGKHFSEIDLSSYNESDWAAFENSCAKASG